MQCPKCQHEAKEFTTPENITLNYCNGCNAIWLDRGELAFLCRTPLDIPELEQISSSAKKTSYNCPKCLDKGRLFELPYAPGSDLLIDCCNSCFGILLDQRELAKAKKIAQERGYLKPIVNKPKVDNKGSKKSITKKQEPVSGPADIVEYAIRGTACQYVEVELEPGKMMISEAGHMMSMSSKVHMETIFGDPDTEYSGLMKKFIGAGKRILTGESLFYTTFLNVGDKKEKVTFAAPHPGNIIAMDLNDLGGEVICQKQAFLCAPRGIDIDIIFQKKIWAGLFGGEGFILQSLKGDGIAFIHAGGDLQKITLAAGEVVKVDTGCIAAFTSSIEYDIQLVGGIKNTLFGGEGLFLATLAGPGEVWCQSLPFSRFASRVIANAPRDAKTGQTRSGESSLLNGVYDLIS